jgi:hypothetical protein
MAKTEKVEEVATKPKKSTKKSTVPEPVVKRDRIDWRALYLYAVCLITMLVCLFSVVSFIRNGVSYVYPDPGYLDPNATGGKAALELAKSAQLTQSHRQSVMGMVDGVTTFIVAAPLYYYHWNLVRKEH